MANNGAPRGSSKTVLLVEDDPDTRESLIELLYDEGYETIAVESGQEALAHLTSHRPCLIIADFVMPDMNGGDLAKAIQSHERLSGIPIVILTAASRHVISTIGVPVLRKPVDIHALLAAVRRNCGSHAAA